MNNLNKTRGLFHIVVHRPCVETRDPVYVKQKPMAETESSDRSKSRVTQKQKILPKICVEKSF